MIHYHSMIYKDIKDFPLYEVNTDGIVRNKLTKRLRKYYFDKDGYNKVTLYNKGFSKHLSVHRIVATAFIKNLLNKKQVNHIDGDKNNNKVSNLEWCTNRENIEHSVINGLRADRRGSSNTMSKLSESDVLNIRKLYTTGCKQREIANTYNIRQDTVSRIVNRKLWSHI